MSCLLLDVPDDFVVTVAERAAKLIRDEHRFLSKEALAEHLGVPERRIKTLRERGLPARKIGRDLYFDLAEVNSWIDREGR